MAARKRGKPRLKRGKKPATAASSKTLQGLATWQGLRPAVQRIAGYLSTTEWLPAGNIYAADGAHGYLKAPMRASDSDMEDFLASAVPIHCMDGWAYLAGSLESQISGDSPRAVHLAYYAELRAAIALLGGRGLAVLNLHHAAIDATPEVWKINAAGGTHDFAWFALQNWASSSDAADLLGASIQFTGISLSNWLDACGLTGSRVALADQWFKTWGADLASFTTDKRSRNLNSYSPSALTTKRELTVAEIDKQLRSFWEAFDPVGSNPFASLDRFLVRAALRSAHSSTASGVPYADVIEQATTQLALDTISGEAARRFLNPVAGSPEDAESDLLSNLGVPLTGPASLIVPGLVARATLLLRLATSSAKVLIDDGNWKSGFGFWIERFGSETGLWDPGARPASLADLRADIDDALNQTGLWLAGAAPPVAKAGWRKTNASDLHLLRSAQLVGLWGLAG